MTRGRLLFALLIVAAFLSRGERRSEEGAHRLPVKTENVVTGSECPHGRVKCPHGCDSCYCSRTNCGHVCNHGPACRGCWLDR